MPRELSYRNEAPICDINMTPLIDVLLVLLIMFIITIPIQTHSVKLDLPGSAPPDAREPEPIKNKVIVTAAGQILWNGLPTSMAGLRHSLGRTQRMQPTPELHFQPEPYARYELVDQVLVASKQAGVRNMGFVGNEQYATF